MGDLAPGTLVVADLGDFGVAWIDLLTDRGLHWLSRVRATTSDTVIHTYTKAKVEPAASCR